MRKLAIGLLALGLAQAGTARAQDITIALVGPITGANAAFGEQMQRGAQEAVKAINPDELTPRAALDLVYRLVGLSRE